MSASPSLVDRLRVALDGRYGVERRLGEGGMATIRLAFLQELRALDVR